MHASILAYMFNLVEEGKISTTLNPTNPVNNQVFIQEYVANLLKSAFPHLQEWVSYKLMLHKNTHTPKTASEDENVILLPYIFNVTWFDIVL